MQTVADRAEDQVVPLTVELVVATTDCGKRGGWVPYAQLLTALECSTGRASWVCDSAIMEAAKSGYLFLDTSGIPEMWRVRTTENGQSLIPEPPAPKESRGRQDVPGWEGSIGPFSGQYWRSHVYARDVHSGAGNCVCGKDLGHDLHLQAAPGVDVPDSMRHSRSAP